MSVASPRKNYIVGLSYDPDVMRHLYGKQPWDYLHESDLYRSWAVYKGEKIDYVSLCDDLGVDEDDSWYESFTTMMTLPNGQVKNFLVACRTCAWLFSGTYRICVRGSKAGHGTGQWHHLFLCFLLSRGIQGTVSFFDPQEDAREYSLTRTGKTLEVRHIASKVDQFTDFDVLIDDAYVPGFGIPGVENLPRVYSLKGDSSSGSPYVPFLHPRETRLFSDQPHSFKPSCPCLLCVAIGHSVTNYKDYVYVRRCCLELGQPSGTCVPGLMNHDLQMKGFIRAELDKKPMVPIAKGIQVRASIALREELPLRVVNHSLMVDRKVTPAYVPYIHNEGFSDTRNRDLKQFSHLEGKEVFFSGVDPIVLGKTQVTAVQIAGGHPIIRSSTIAFLAESDAYPQVQSCYVVYMKGSKLQLEKRFPDRRFSGRTVSSFLEMVRFLSPKLAPDIKTFPVPYECFMASSAHHSMTYPMALDRSGQYICDCSPLPFVYDLDHFFLPRCSYSSAPPPEPPDLEWLCPIEIDRGVVITRGSTKKVLPEDRNPVLTLWRSRNHWGCCLPQPLGPFKLRKDYSFESPKGLGQKKWFYQSRLYTRVVCSLREIRKSQPPDKDLYAGFLVFSDHLSSFEGTYDYLFLKKL